VDEVTDDPDFFHMNKNKYKLTTERQEQQRPEPVFLDVYEAQELIPRKE
jgi:hypothetical protein